MAHDERPKNWRPFSDEQRASFVAAGFSDEAIAEQEAKNEYMPIEQLVTADALAWATIDVLTKRFGPAFADDVRATLRRRAEKLAGGGVEDKADATIIAELADGPYWDAGG